MLSQPMTDAPVASAPEKCCDECVGS